MIRASEYTGDWLTMWLHSSHDNVVKTKIVVEKKVENLIPINNISIPFLNWKMSVIPLVSVVSVINTHACTTSTSIEVVVGQTVISISGKTLACWVVDPWHVHGIDDCSLKKLKAALSCGHFYGRNRYGWGAGNALSMSIFSTMDP